MLPSKNLTIKLFAGVHIIGQLGKVFDQQLGKLVMNFGAIEKAQMKQSFTDGATFGEIETHFLGVGHALLLRNFDQIRSAAWNLLLELVAIRTSYPHDLFNGYLQTLKIEFIKAVYLNEPQSSRANLFAFPFVEKKLDDLSLYDSLYFIEIVLLHCFFHETNELAVTGHSDVSVKQSSSA